MDYSPRKGIKTQRRVYRQSALFNVFFLNICEIILELFWNHRISEHFLSRNIEYVASHR